jgi:hypothetical protein
MHSIALVTSIRERYEAALSVSWSDDDNSLSASGNDFSLVFDTLSTFTATAAFIFNSLLSPTASNEEASRLVIPTLHTIPICFLQHLGYDLASADMKTKRVLRILASFGDCSGGDEGDEEFGDASAPEMAMASLLSVLMTVADRKHGRYVRYYVENSLTVIIDSNSRGLIVC